MFARMAFSFETKMSFSVTDGKRDAILLLPQNQQIVVDIASYGSQSELSKMDIGYFDNY